MEKEQWKTVIYDGEKYEDYEVSSLGRIRSLNYHRSGKIHELKPRKTSKGYLEATLYKDSKRKVCKVHRMVAFTFIINDDIENKIEVNHIDENKENNSIENLEWCTPKQNSNHGTRTKRMQKKLSRKVMGKSLTENKVIVFQSANQASKFGFKHGSISRCCNGKLKQHKGFTWQYIDN